MTREEEIKKIAMCYAHDELKDNHGDVEDVVASAFIDGANYADSHPHWISIEDSLPKEHQWFLGYSPMKSAMLVDVYNFDSNGLIEAHCITYWMPLPSLPSCSVFPNNSKKGGEQ